MLAINTLWRLLITEGRHWNNYLYVKKTAIARRCRIWLNCLTIGVWIRVKYCLKNFRYPIRRYITLLLWELQTYSRRNVAHSDSQRCHLRSQLISTWINYITLMDINTRVHRCTSLKWFSHKIQMEFCIMHVLWMSFCAARRHIVGNKYQKSIRTKRKRGCDQLNKM